MWFFCAALLVSLAFSVVADDGYDELRGQIITSVETGQRLDVSPYRLELEALNEIYEDLFHRGLLPWYADSYFDWSSSPDGTVSVLVPRDLRDRGYDEDLYERTMAELLAATCHDGMTPAEMVLSVHDYIVARVQYTRYLGTINTGYHALVKEETACYGYAQLFMRVMARLGIPCQIAVCDDTGDGVGHAWNVVQLDGNWYHVDLTWDDPVPEAQGRVMHNHFLKTDKEFQRNGHSFGWESDVECTDDTYSSGTLWKNINSPFLFPNGGTMLLRRDADKTLRIYARDLQTGQETLLHSQELAPVQLEGAYYSCNSVGLSFWNERIWFNTLEAIYSMNIDGSDLQTAYTFDTAENGKFIYSCLVDDGVMRLALVDLDDEITAQQVELTDVAYHTHSYESVRVDATCAQEGYRQNSCACGVTYYMDRTAPLEHALAQEDLDGGIRHYCLNCGYAWEEAAPTTEPAPTEPQPTEPPAAEPSDPLPALLGGGIVLIAAVILLCVRRKKR